MRSCLILAAAAALLAVGIADQAQARHWGCFGRSYGCYSPCRSYGWSSYSYCRPSYYASYCGPSYYRASCYWPSSSWYCSPSYSYPSCYYPSYSYSCGPYATGGYYPYASYSAGYAPYVSSGNGPYEPSYVYDPQSASNTSAIVSQVAGELLDRLAARRATPGQAPLLSNFSSRLANLRSRTTVSTAPARSYTNPNAPVIESTPVAPSNRPTTIQAAPLSGTTPLMANTPVAPSRRVLAIQPDPFAGTTAISVAKPQPAQPAVSNAAAVERAQQFIGYGDRYFIDQKYRDAVERYRSAASAAPDLAEAHFRLAFGYIATNRPQLAAAAFRKGLALDKQWPKSDFHLNDLYKDSRLAKQSHLDVLAQTALNSPNDADAFFALGVFLHCDGQSDRAQKFFARTKELSPGSTLVDAFLPREKATPVASPTTPVTTQAPTGFDA